MSQQQTTDEPVRILRLDASARINGSQSRHLVDELMAILTDGGSTTIARRDLSKPVPLVDEAWIEANFTPEDQRTEAQKAKLAISDMLVEELKAADILVIGLPLYNFGVPANLKAWIDQVARARVTFRYTENGAVGLLEGKKAYIVAVSGGTQIGSDIDFATGYLRHVLKFLGITDVTLIAADRLMADDGQKVEAARDRIRDVVTPVKAA